MRPLFLFTFWRSIALIILFFDLMFIPHLHTMLDFRLANQAFPFLPTAWCCMMLLSFTYASSFSTICILSSFEFFWNKLIMHLCLSFLTMLHNVETNLNWKNIRFAKEKRVWKEGKKPRKCKKCQLNCSNKKYQVSALNDHNWLFESSLSTIIGIIIYWNIYFLFFKKTKF